MTELSNLCGLAQVRAVKKSCHAALVFSHIAIVLDRPLAEAKELVDDPAAFTREMTRILRDKQTHPLIAQMMRPAESSDPPPATAAASGASSSGEPRTTSHVQFQ